MCVQFSKNLSVVADPARSPDPVDVLLDLGGQDDDDNDHVHDDDDYGQPVLSDPGFCHHEYCHKQTPP